MFTGDNGAVRPRLHRRAAAHGAVGRLRAGALVLASALLLVGCGDDPPAGAPSAEARGPVHERKAPARARLAALAAAAADRKFSAFYTLSTPGRPDRTVAVTLAMDGSWRVDIPGGALGGTVDVAVAQTADGLFQCALSWSTRFAGPSCVRAADRGSQLADAVDPGVQHLFTDWVRVLSDRQAPLAVSDAQPLDGAAGECFSVESTSASLNPPLEVGIYCYDAEGTLTGARVGFGTLLLAGAPVAAPASVTLPGPVVAGEPLETAAPPPPVSPGAVAPAG